MEKIIKFFKDAWAAIVSVWPKLKAFFGFCFAVVGSIGGIGCACYTRAYFIAVCVAVLAVLAFPKVKEFVKELIG